MFDYGNIAKEQREGALRIPSGCAVSGIIDRSGKRFSGADIVKSISVMHERSNGLGGGFAAYGIYPDYKEYYAFHIFYDNAEVKTKCEAFLDGYYDIANLSKIPTRKIPQITNEPLIWRYFVTPSVNKLKEMQIDEREFVARSVFQINTGIEGAYVFSCGKNMGVFKAVGYPEDVGNFYRLEEYEGYAFTAHGRYPTNTPGWWGGAHPFALLDYSVVHNGEISSYDTNRRTIEMYGYKCSLQTDTEVITYIIDYLHRKKGLSFHEIAATIAAPFWQTIERMGDEDKKTAEYLRNKFSSLLITGPFSLIIGHSGGLVALNDRLKLRSMVVAEKGSLAYIASEEAAIRRICPDCEKVRAPRGGEAVVFSLSK
ncbi:MAG: glutamine amidotransferase family protein [Christensenellaceae bacterium]|jgi:glutamate synthase domain-containing protein 1|nr:glutamine amidotransferase family protein [Christensenellaceae bacterium]